MNIRRWSVAIASTAVVVLVAVGPGDMAFGANPNDSNVNGARGHNTPRSGPGAPGADSFGRGRDGRQGKEGADGASGRSIPGIDGDRIDVDLPFGRGARGVKGLKGRISREVRQRVRLNLQARNAAS